MPTTSDLSREVRVLMPNALMDWLVSTKPQDVTLAAHVRRILLNAKEAAEKSAGRKP